MQIASTHAILILPPLSYHSCQHETCNVTHIIQNPQSIWDPIYIYINIFINILEIINSLKMCYLYQYDVSKFCFGGCEYKYKIYKFVTLVQISLESKLATSAAVHGVAVIVHIICSSTLRTRWYIPRRVIL